MKPQTWHRSLLSYGALAIAAVFALFPIMWMVTLSFRPNGQVFTVPPRLLPPTPTLEAYGNVLGAGGDIRFFINSYVVALSVTAVSLLLALLAGYSFSRFKYSGSKPLQLFIIGTQMVPPISLIIPYFLLITAIGIYNSYSALILTLAFPRFRGHPIVHPRSRWGAGVSLCTTLPRQTQPRPTIRKVFRPSHPLSAQLAFCPLPSS